jgi:2-dehydro-3-deoxyphosphogluconate aldolase / (4S)-4-hydroxy-2-oxoglutarate aldolase
MEKKEKALQIITNQGLLPLFFYRDPEVSLGIVKTLYKAGIRTLEYTNRGKEALDNFAFLKNEIVCTCPDMQLGIGTIKTAAEAALFIEAGADYIVAPVVNPEVGEIAHKAGLLWIPGCMTPTEINLARQHNAALIKIFPADLLGPGYISQVRDLFPGQLFIPTGGVEIDAKNIKSWFKSGVSAIGMGSRLISYEILDSRAYDVLLSRTELALKLIEMVRNDAEA